MGIILVTDVSRLARNCGDRYQFLDLASVYYGTLLSSKRPAFVCLERLWYNGSRTRESAREGKRCGQLEDAL